MRSLVRVCRVFVLHVVFPQRGCSTCLQLAGESHIYRAFVCVLLCFVRGHGATVRCAPAAPAYHVCRRFPPPAMAIIRLVRGLVAVPRRAAPPHPTARRG